MVNPVRVLSLVLLTVAIGHAKYIKSSVGTCVDSTFIDTLEECERAAVALSLIDTTTQSALTISVNTRPFGCYYNTRADELYFNTIGDRSDDDTDRAVQAQFGPYYWYRRCVLAIGGVRGLLLLSPQVQASCRRRYFWLPRTEGYET
jgi:hypothetical protein